MIWSQHFPSLHLICTERVTMKKSDVQCPDCSAAYRRIELISEKGKPGTYHCLVCRRPLETFDGSTQIVYRLTVTPERPAKKRA
jgi:hypothetical protein